MAVAGLSQITNLSEALALLQRGDFAAVEKLLADVSADPQGLTLLGLARLKQGNFAAAADSFARARALAPQEARPAFGLGEALSALDRNNEAADAYQAAIAIDPAFLEARYGLGNVLHRMGRTEEAQKALEDLLARAPGHVPAQLALGAVLIDAKRPREAERPLREGLAMPAPQGLKAALHTNLGLALRRQRKDEEARAQYDQALALDPAQPGLALHRAEALQNLERYDEALAVYERALAADAANPELHHRYNALLYRLNRRDTYLTSYDRAPASRTLRLGKASLLLQELRGEEALEIYRALLAQSSTDRAAVLGAAKALSLSGRADEALTLLEFLLAEGEDAALLVRACEIALYQCDPQKAQHFGLKALALAPYDQLSLAHLSLAWRMMDDAREAALNGYEDFVQVFDLEPPEGFSRMEDFNAELCAYLDRLHPRTREYVDQSLRGGTQTPDHVFGAGHDLIDRLERRIAQAVARYVSALKGAEDHPMVSRRAGGFAYAGSWSSRLTNCGFHVNHVHPDGWISSCYYAGVPPVVAGSQSQQGWIKFGEPPADLDLAQPPRRAVQPVPGRLVLFPSYMWHGTIPFQDAEPRMTIAFDVVPRLKR